MRSLTALGDFAAHDGDRLSEGIFWGKRGRSFEHCSR
jgi:hypothetical protein